jgi:hypothetical protein
MIMETYRVDRGKLKPPVEFTGELIAETRSASSDRRWVELKLYALEGGGYLVHRAGMSNVYHRAGTTCTTASGLQQGTPGTVEDLPDDALPCERCEPPWPEDLGDNEQIRYETTRHTIDRVDTPAEVVEKLTVYRNRRTGRREMRFSEPVQDLLAKAVANDPGFLMPDQPVERIA